ncbi:MULTISPECIES: glycosyltransferase [Aeromonas]|uniref:glycosyltransferase n=1 Tax=Aeromonas TaxID=642 RepID=UPI0034A2D006
MNQAFYLLGSSLGIKMIDIAAVVICKNEERYIKRCLNSLVNRFSRVIVIDTGSTDRTLEIVKRSFYNYGVELFEYSWKGSFSLIRNYALSIITSEFIFFIDGDEEFLYNHQGWASFEKMIESCCYDVFSVKILSSSDGRWGNVPRIIRNKSGCYYYGNVHEMILNNDLEVNHFPTNLELKHYGYQPNLLWGNGKLYRNISLVRPHVISGPYKDRWLYFYIRDSILNGCLSKRIFKMSVDFIDKLSPENDHFLDNRINIINLIMEMAIKKEQYNVVAFFYLRYRFILAHNPFMFYLYFLMILERPRTNGKLYLDIACKESFKSDFEWLNKNNIYVYTLSNDKLYIKSLEKIVETLL